MESDHVNEPLMYIEQPELVKPRAQMQMHFLSRRDKEIEQEQGEVESEQVGENSFKQLSIEGKIKYLMQLPEEVPKIKCEIITNEENYKGTVMNYEDDLVDIRILGRENKKVRVDQITNIRLIGF